MRQEQLGALEVAAAGGGHQGGRPRGRVVEVEEGAEAVGSEAGRPLLDVDVRRPGALVPWLLARGGDVAVVQPESLREAVRAEADRLLARYRGEPGAPVATVAGSLGEREMEA